MRYSIDDLGVGNATHLHYEVKVNNQNIDPSEDPQSNLLLDPQEIIKDHNGLPEIVIIPSPIQPEPDPNTDNKTNQ